MEYIYERKFSFVAFSHGYLGYYRVLPGYPGL